MDMPSRQDGGEFIKHIQDLLDASLGPEAALPTVMAAVVEQFQAETETARRKF